MPVDQHEPGIQKTGFMDKLDIGIRYCEPRALNMAQLCGKSRNETTHMAGNAMVRIVAEKMDKQVH